LTNVHLSWLDQRRQHKWLADYYGTSLAMIEKHYGKYIRNDTDEQLDTLSEAKPETHGGGTA